MQRLLKESYSDEELINFLKTKLGLLDTKKVFKKENSTSLNDLTDETIDYLKNIKKDNIRKFSTTKLNNAWLTVRGASQTRRDLSSRLPAYLFMYFTDGTFVEGSTKDSIKKYTGPKLEKTVIDQKLSEIKDDLNSLGLVNIVDLKNPNNKDGKCLIVSLKETTSVVSAQNIVKEAFTNTSDNIFSKLTKSFEKAFKKPENVTLTDYIFDSSSEIQMYWTKEEEDIATEILTKASSSKKEINKKDIDTQNQEKPKKATKKSFNRTFFGKQAKEFIKDTSKLQNFEDARAELAKDWNDKDAATVMSNVANIMKHTYTKDKAELTKRLRDMNLIEKVSKTKKLLEDTTDNYYNDLLSMFQFDLLKNAVFTDREECMYAGLGMKDLLDLLNDVLPTYIGVENLEDAYTILDNATLPEAKDYKILLDTCVENAKFVDEN